MKLFEKGISQEMKLFEQKISGMLQQWLTRGRPIQQDSSKSE